MKKRILVSLLFVVALFGYAWAWTASPVNTTAFDAVMTRGRTITSGSQTVHVFLYDDQAKIVFANGTGLPATGTAGYAKGAIFIDGDVASGTSGFYENIGTPQSVLWRALGINGSANTIVDNTVVAADIQNTSLGANKFLFNSVLLTIADNTAINTVAVESGARLLGVQMYSGFTNAFVNSAVYNGSGFTATMNGVCQTAAGCIVNATFVRPTQ